MKSSEFEYWPTDIVYGKHWEAKYIKLREVLVRRWKLTDKLISESSSRGKAAGT